jgi:hypothetical protein
MYKKITTITTLALAVSSTAFANTQILSNTDFSDGFTGWIAGSNKFVGGVWQEFVQAPDAYAFEDRVVPSGQGFIFKSWDDEVSDSLENYLFQEFGAGPAGSPTAATLFQTGDVIVFKGSASATRVGTDTSDMVVRAFIKLLGYNEFGWEFQLKEENSAFHPVGSALEPFELSVTFPDLVEDDSFQVIQLGFEISVAFDSANPGNAMDSGEIYFENIQGYIVGEEEEVTWAGYVLDENGNADTGAWMGMVNATHAPWIYSYLLGAYVYIPEDGVSAAGGWAFTLVP